MEDRSVDAYMSLVYVRFFMLLSLPIRDAGFNRSTSIPVAAAEVKPLLGRLVISPRYGAQV